MRSSDVARIAGVSTRTLRHYHAIGLLPEPPRSENGYRIYEAMDLARVLHIKRLATLGFPLAQIKVMLEDATDVNVDAPASAAHTEIEALQELDRALEMQIEQLTEQRSLIAQLQREQLNPSLPIRFARAVKNLYEHLPKEASQQATEHDRATLLLTAHFYDEDALQELERFSAAAQEKQLLSPLYQIEKEIGELKPDATESQRARLVAQAMELLEPLMDCFDAQNWSRSTKDDTASIVDALIKETMNPAQQDVEARIEQAIIERVTRANKSESESDHDCGCEHDCACD